jgi:hypothetical protein
LRVQQQQALLQMHCCTVERKLLLQQSGYLRACMQVSAAS